ncbi:hypothetical protein GPJ56_003432 [Histomonas meleagridis]|uniref:uncharacterized protein n=1 Tax=Histomonas meleagridis TaxID=135588 RepID=UPI00355A3CB1|nr:hypothetical protein GPJ56_003432 [Histomonas meleagridis]KAH0799124.1 hypothetical protein GO595_007921 [Histomonas meleagridis]
MWGRQNSKPSTNAGWGTQNKTGTTQNKTGTTQGKTGTGAGSNWLTNTGTNLGITATQTQNKQSVPATTNGINFEPTTVQIFVQEAGSEQPFAVHHIINYDIFKQYTIEELRYYDYLSHGFCKPPQQTGFGTGFGTSNQGTQFSYGQQQTAQPYPVSPWKKQYPDKTSTVPTSSQAQPYGAFPATQLSVSKTDFDVPDEAEANEIPVRRSFLGESLLKDNLSSSSTSATPGIYKSLIARRFQTAEKSRYSLFAIRSIEAGNN